MEITHTAIQEIHLQIEGHKGPESIEKHGARIGQAIMGFVSAVNRSEQCSCCGYRVRSYAWVPVPSSNLERVVCDGCLS